ncbi:sigma-70 family RNA polymerase sigma factor, partial [Sulfobacillus harzensis]
LGDLVAGSADDAVWSRLQHRAQQEAVDHLLEILTPREADVLRLRYGIAGAPMTLQEVGEVFHLTRERIRQIEAKALKKLQSWVSRHPEFGLRDLMTD